MNRLISLYKLLQDKAADFGVDPGLDSEPDGTDADKHFEYHSDFFDERLRKLRGATDPDEIREMLIDLRVHAISLSGIYLNSVEEIEKLLAALRSKQDASAK